jgi:hypothetical protein
MVFAPAHGIITTLSKITCFDLIVSGVDDPFSSTGMYRSTAVISFYLIDTLYE